MDGRNPASVLASIRSCFADLVGGGAAHASDEVRYVFGQLKAQKAAALFSGTVEGDSRDRRGHAPDAYGEVEDDRLATHHATSLDAVT